VGLKLILLIGFILFGLALPLYATAEQKICLSAVILVGNVDAAFDVTIVRPSEAGAKAGETTVGLAAFSPDILVERARSSWGYLVVADQVGISPDLRQDGFFRFEFTARRNEDENRFEGEVYVSRFDHPKDRVLFARVSSPFTKMRLRYNFQSKWTVEGAIDGMEKFDTEWGLDGLWSPEMLKLIKTILDDSRVIAQLEDMSIASRPDEIQSMPVRPVTTIVFRDYEELQLKDEPD